MKIGKLSNEQLEGLVLNNFNKKRKEVLVYPQIGLDCCTLDIGDELCVLSTDPITAANDNLGFIAVNVCCNDAAAAGAIPVGVMTSLLLPPSTSEDLIKKIAGDVSRAADKINVDVVGGHTEITDAVTRPIMSVTVIAKTQNRKIINTAQMKAGDTILMTKFAGIEGTAIIVNDFLQKVKGILTDSDIIFCKNLINEISVIDDGICAAKNGATAMHDITEGGVLGAVWEMAQASNCGAQIFKESIPLLPQTEKICSYLDIDYLKLISSGSMLIACQNAELIISELAKINIKCSKIGIATQQKKILLDDEIINPPKADELYKLFCR